jgi:hypothetical protein
MEPQRWGIVVVCLSAAVGLAGVTGFVRQVGFAGRSGMVPRPAHAVGDQRGVAEPAGGDQVQGFAHGAHEAGAVVLARRLLLLGSSLTK